MNQNHYNDLGELYSRFYRKAFLFTRSYVHDEQVAEDIASEALIKMWSEVRRQQINHPDSFLLAMLRNRALDWPKHQKMRGGAFKKMEESLRDELDMRISMLEACNPTEVFTAEISKIVEETLARFPEKTRRIFQMSRLENMPHAQIANTTGLSLKSVEYHITKVLRELREELKDYLPIYLFYFFFH